MFHRSVLIVAFLICAPILWSAVVDESVTLESAGIRFLVALPVAGILVGLVRLAARPTEKDVVDTDGTINDPAARHTP